MDELVCPSRRPGKVGTQSANRLTGRQAIWSSDQAPRIAVTVLDTSVTFGLAARDEPGYRTAPSRDNPARRRNNTSGFLEIW